MIGHLLTVDVIGFVGNWWVEYKNTGSYSRLSFSFPFSLFSATTSLSPFCACHAGHISLLTGNEHIRTMTNQNNVILFCFFFFLFLFFNCIVNQVSPKTLFTWSGGPRSSGVGFFCFHAPLGSPSPCKQALSQMKFRLEILH